MHAVALVYRSELRRRAASWALLSLLVGLVAGTVLAAIAAGRATDQAFPRFVARYGVNAAVFESAPPQRLVGVRNVSAVFAQAAYPTGDIKVNGRTISSSSLSLGAVPRAGGASMVKLLSGHWPSKPNDVVVSYTIEQQFGVHAGTTLPVQLYRKDQFQQVLTSNTTVPPRGPAIRMTVVGVEANVMDFPSGPPSYSAFVGPGFSRLVGAGTLKLYAAYVRFRHGAADFAAFQSTVTSSSKFGALYLQAVDPLDAAVERSIHPQAVGWWILALLAGIGGLGVVGQALARQSLVAAEAYPTLRALGFLPVQLFQLGLARALSIGLGGAAGAIALAWALSPLTPVGEARIADPVQGFAFDLPVLLLGAVTTVVITVALAAFPARRHSRAALADARSEPLPAPASGLFAWVSRAGGAPSALVGMRRALDRGRGRSTVPVASALVGASVAVTALVATAVFGASLSNLTGTPRLYGRGWDLQLSGGGQTGRQALDVVRVAERYKAVTAVSYGLPGNYLQVGGNSVQVLIASAARGRLLLSTVSGRDPSGPGEVALGTTTLRQSHAAVGDLVSIRLVARGGHAVTGRMRVVGTVAFPADLGTGGLGVGALVTVSGAATLICQASADPRTCVTKTVSQLEATHGWGVLIKAAPGPAGRAALAALAHRYPTEVALRRSPTDLVNFGEAVNFPLLLGIAMALFGAATFVHLLVVSVARRRRDVALLKALGFVRAQIVAAVCWQATTVALVAGAVGVPIGIAVGRVVWRTFAFNLGAVPVSVVPGLLVAGIAAAIVAGANVLALIPALSAARLRPSEALRDG